MIQTWSSSTSSWERIFHLLMTAKNVWTIIRSWLWPPNSPSSSVISSVHQHSWSSIEMSTDESTCNHFSTRLWERTISSKPVSISVFTIQLVTDIWQKITFVSTFPSWSLLSFILRTWMRASRRSISWLLLASSSSSSTPKELEESTSRTCSPPPFWLNSMNLGRKDTLNKISAKIGSPFNIQLHWITASISSTLIKMDFWRKKTSLNTQRACLRLWLIVFSRNTQQWMERWTTKVFYNLCWQWITRRLHKLFNTFGECWTCTTKGLLTRLLSICSSAPSSKNCKPWKNAGSMLKTSRTKYSIWPSQNSPSPLLSTTSSNASKEISSFRCWSTPRPSLTMTNVKTGKPWKYMMIFDMAINWLWILGLWWIFCIILLYNLK